MMKFETGIPIPPLHAAVLGQARIWGDFQVGQSVLLAGKKYRHGKNAVTYLKKRYRFQCECRLVDGGVRVWRIG